jgi:hypothetical protein
VSARGPAEDLVWQCRVALHRCAGLGPLHEAPAAEELGDAELAAGLDPDGSYAKAIDLWRSHSVPTIRVVSLLWKRGLYDEVEAEAQVLAHHLRSLIAQPWAGHMAARRREATLAYIFLRDFGAAADAAAAWVQAVGPGRDPAAEAMAAYGAVMVEGTGPVGAAFDMLAAHERSFFNVPVVLLCSGLAQDRTTLPTWTPGRGTKRCR